MRHSIYRISVTAHSMPFPMPSPQREQAMRILMEEAKSAGVAAAMLVTHLPRAEERSYTEPKVKAMRRIMADVDGMSIRMLSRAFRRDCHRIRDMLGKNSTNATAQATTPAPTNDDHGNKQ